MHAFTGGKSVPEMASASPEKSVLFVTVATAVVLYASWYRCKLHLEGPLLPAITGVKQSQFIWITLN